MDGEEGTPTTQTNALDTGGLIAAADPGGMLGLIGQIPAHLRDAWAITRSLSLTDAHRATTSAALLGMGGSAIAGDLVSGGFAGRLRVPLTAGRGGERADWVAPS